MACGQLQQSGADPTNEVSMKFTWWPFRRGGPPEDAEQRKWLLAPHQRKWLLVQTNKRPRQRKWLMAPHQRKWPLVQVKKHHQQKWLLAPHQWKLLLMRILPKSQDPEADGGPDDKFSLAPLTQRHRRVQSEAIATKMSRLRRRDLHKVGAKAACVDAAAAYVDVAGLRASTWPGSPSHKVAGPNEGQVDSMRLDLHKVGARSRVRGRGGCVCGRGRILLQHGEEGHHMLRRWNVISKF